MLLENPPKIATNRSNRNIKFRFEALCEQRVTKKGAADYRTERLGLWPQVLLVRGSLALALSTAASGACSAPATPQAGFNCQNCCWIKKLNSFSHHSTSSGQDQDSETDSVWLSGKGFHLFFNPCYLIAAFLKAYKCATGEWVKIQRQRDIQLPFM